MAIYLDDFVRENTYFGFGRRATTKEARPTNEQQIRTIMKIKHQKGNPKDFVVVVGHQLIDYWDVYNLEPKDPSKVSDPRHVALLHKKDLHKYFGDDAAFLWNRKLGVRVPGKTRAQRFAENMKRHGANA